jgi:AbrB family looped-hinge helix DNA binding protein
MASRKVSDIVIRPKRQVTLPKDICDQLGIDTGDVLELTVENSVITARLRKTAALESLKEIQQAFKRSGMAEEEILDTGRRVREEVARERYGVKA